MNAQGSTDGATPSFTSNVRRGTIILLGTAAVGILIAIVARLFGPLSPEEVRRRTLAALDRRDVRALCQLADPDEMKRLNLEERQVEVMLRETLWRDGPLSPVKNVFLFSDEPMDRRFWVVHFTGEKEGRERPRFGVAVVDDPKKGWKLVLSEMLFHAYRYKEKPDLFVQRCREMKIAGLRDQFGYYRMFADFGNKLL
jgi:hypothetical protein